MNHAPLHPCAGRGKRGARGFTLVELTVSLLAGLIVAMGIVGLSREATNTFHEEARSSAAEASLRTAVDRLRADLQRAGFMSTGNIMVSSAVPGAPRIAHVLSSPSNYATGAPTGIQTLTSLQLQPGGSLLTNGLALSAQQPIPVTPDALLISGNMTSADQFDVASINTTLTQGCYRIYLVPTSPAVYRVIGQAPYSATASTDLKQLFFPSTTASAQFIIRLVDTNQCAQYLATCTSGPVAGIEGATNLPFVDVDAQTPIVTASAAGTSCGVSGFGEGCSVNPVQTIKWEITSQGPGDGEPAAYANLGGSAAAGTKYDLMRSYVSANNPNSILPDTSEIIAEYAVDLSFAFSVETGSALTPAILTFAFDNPMLNNPWATAPYNALNQGPQRIRSVRARLVTRAAQADRAINIAVAPANYANEQFAYRYCIAPAGCGSNPNNALIWARTRTITTEVSLPNQAGNFY